MHIEELFQPPNLDLLKQTLTVRAKFLGEVEACLVQLVIEFPETFRRPPTSRLKKIRSIYHKLALPGVSRDEFFKKLAKLNDVAGIRLTVASKDLYPVVEELLNQRLAKFGSLKKTRDVGLQKEDDSYLGEHYVLRNEPQPELRCEIQVRTLTHDLWAVFDHYESYKKEQAPRMIGEDLKNYARLMDVADDYARTIRLRKIEEAEQHHRKKVLVHRPYGVAEEEILTYAEFERILHGQSGSAENESIRSSPIEATRLCDVLRQLSKYDIYTRSELQALVENDVYKTYIRERQASIGVEGGPFDDFAILCDCYRADPVAVKEKYLSSVMRDRIDSQIRAIKLEEDAEREIRATG